MEGRLRNFLNENLLEAGCDEAGRGPLAGPVFAAAVILPKDFYHPKLNDSKKMSQKAREELRPIIEREAIAWAVTAVDAQEIDRINILNAALAGMQRSVMKLSVAPEFLLIDGNRFRSFTYIAERAAGGDDVGLFGHSEQLALCSKYDCIPYKCVVKGDATFASIAAASVLAKTYRDEYMCSIAKDYPQYGWEKNMGYPTAEHIEAIKNYGFTPYHRMTFKVK